MTMPVTEHPSVSILVPVFNGETYLAEALDSALSQTYQDCRVQLFDNCSTDSTVDVALTRLSHQQIIVSDTNMGAVANFNRSYASTSEKYVMWLASDDRIHPEFVSRCISALLASPTAPACLTGIRFIDEHGSQLRIQTDLELADPRARRRLRAFLRRPRWTEFYCLYRREALPSAGVMENEWGADVLLTWQLLLKSPLVVLAEPLLEYREYPKTLEDQAVSLDPHSGGQHWRLAGMWRRMWTLTKAPGVSRHVGRAARLELVLALIHHQWLRHLLNDAQARYPMSLGQVVDLVKKPWRRHQSS